MSKSNATSQVPVPPAFGAEYLSVLRQRIPEWHLRRRFQRQIEHAMMRLDTRSFRLFDVYWENVDLLPKLLGVVLRLTGKLEEARQATLDYRIHRAEFVLPGLPVQFDNYRILHLSDLHIDQIVDGGQALFSTISSLDFDLCVLTGDYRFDTYGPYEDTLKGMERLLPVLDCPDGVIGILGNHDIIEMLPYLESLGITMLMNEVTTVQRGDQHLWIAGLDDCHYYQVADLQGARAPIPAGAADVLLVHSPELIAEADSAGVSLYLCGHTHGGQVCLPGGIPLITNARCARRYARGTWRAENMQGYTSSGVGSSGIPVRVNCPPEIALHTLRC